MTLPVRYTPDGEVGVISVCNPPVNALSHAVRQGLLEAMTAAQDDATRAVLIVCEGRTFIAGADISEFGKPLKDPWLPDLLNIIERSSKLVVAAIHGTALGGGFETALAAHFRCAVRSAKVGFPEVNLGLLPGAGGTQRAPRLAGVQASLDLIASGKPIGAQQALDIGLIDHIVDGDLTEGAMVYTRGLIDAGTAIRRSSELPAPSFSADAFADYRAVQEKKARGQIAPGHIVSCVEAATTMPFAAGLARERELFMACMESPQSTAMRHVFFAERQAAKVDGIEKDHPKRPVNSVGVVGGGTMGGGIAMCFANAGIPVTLIEINDEALERGLSIVDGNYAGSVKRGKLSGEKAAECRGRISGSTDYAALGDVDMVIEAVFEDPELKKKIFARLDSVCKSGAILATNTSYQDVDRIAAATERPQDVIGTHFFSPAHIMKLLEVVRGEKTADDVLATVMALARKIRKIPVVSGVCYGFIGNRMLRPYGKTAQVLLLEGASPEQVDRAMENWGMAMGPFRVFDLAGLDVGYKARQALSAEAKGDPATWLVPDRLVEMGRHGQKTGAGFYQYNGRIPSPDPRVLEVVEAVAAECGVQRREIGDDEIVERLISALVEEGRKILDEGIAQRSSDIDIVYIYGYGFPAARGGPMYYAEHGE